MQVLFLVFLFIIGSCFGSFLCCQARRLHLRVTHPKHQKPGNRSICLSCKQKLAWYDNLPIISWLILSGKCRHCHHKIGPLELLSELGVGFAFLAVGATITPTAALPLEWFIFFLTLVFTAMLSFLAIYDGAYGELPVFMLILSIISAFFIIFLKNLDIALIAGFTPELILNPLASVAILGGLYLALYLVSKGKWVGDGDWLLGVAIGLALGNPWLALVALFLANFTACLAMAPTMKKNSHHKIHFGPFMVIAFVITLAFSNFLLQIIGG